MAREWRGLILWFSTGRRVGNVYGDPVSIGGVRGSVPFVSVTVTEGQDYQVDRACLEWSWH